MKNIGIQIQTKTSQNYMASNPWALPQNYSSITQLLLEGGTSPSGLGPTPTNSGWS